MAVIPAIILLALVLMPLPLCIGVYVYRDARRRDMNAPLWALAAVLGPTFSGLILYLLTRSSHPDLVCSVCGGKVAADHRNCPHCAAPLRASCPACGRDAEAGWKVCPHCAAPLPPFPADAAAPRPRRDRSLGKILLGAVLVPLLLCLLVTVCSFSAYSGAMNVSRLDIGDYLAQKQQPMVETWMEGCTDFDTVYVLRYRDGERKVTHHLVYSPYVTDTSTFDMGRTAGIIRRGVRLEITNSGGAGGKTFYLVSAYGSEDAALEVFLDGRQMDISFTDIGWNPAPVEFISE